MAVTHEPPSTGQGPFWNVAWSIGSVSDWFENISQDIDGVPIIGNRLSYPFYAISWYLDQAANRLYSADDTFVRVRDWLQHIVNGTGFINLLYWSSNNFRLIRENLPTFILNALYAVSSDLYSLAINPIGFVNAKIRQISGYLSWFIDDPMGLFVSFFRAINWWLGWFIDNPSDWLRNFLRGVSWHIGLIVDNPLGFVNHYLRSLSGQLGQIIDNPVNWFWGKIWEISPDLYHLAVDTSFYLKTRIAAYLGFDMSFWVNPIDYLTRRILERIRLLVGFYANTLKDIIIDLILIFI